MAWPLRKKTVSIDILMKSGNTIQLDDIIKCDVSNIGDTITSIAIEYHHRAKTRLMVKTISLSQIEAVVVIY